MCRLEEEFEKEAVCHQFCSTCMYSERLTKEALDGLGDFNIGGKII